MTIIKTILILILASALSICQVFCSTPFREATHSEVLVSEVFECPCQGQRAHVPLTASFLQKINFVERFDLFLKQMMNRHDQKSIPEAVWAIHRALNLKALSVHLDDLIEVLSMMVSF